MYVCVCNAVTDHEIRDARAQGVRTLPELRDVMGVATCCGACEDTAHDILAEEGCAMPDCCRENTVAA
jgi:bacterioferritin-associated ferredoxin